MISSHEAGLAMVKSGIRSSSEYTCTAREELLQI
jgi:hypothetical protein